MTFFWPPRAGGQTHRSESGTLSHDLSWHSLIPLALPRSSPRSKSSCRMAGTDPEAAAAAILVVCQRTGGAEGRAGRGRQALRSGHLAGWMLPVEVGS